MIEFLMTYWFATVPTALTGVVLLGMLKKMRDEKTRKEKVLATAVARRKQQG
ncbi:MAG: hypothetical protein KIS95_05715 [Anaerolineae bacterium]|uniref:hypothetical protein n=1 Tax=Promineifilum sp. TaxID=2664178 RepID=UPI001D8377BF|nr:hypothetical protein [Anaerolineales bacterium]MCB8934711.1 hypothetical protein [Promineifilum sp.]MCO5180931.1 hypothetical protein [Promineifilum sp.]MCW5846707.1 hypothetical protein [Anaerolineae bacterium]